MFMNLLPCTAIHLTSVRTQTPLLKDLVTKISVSNYFTN
jgi:hypothetical protein